MWSLSTASQASFDLSVGAGGASWTPTQAAGGAAARRREAQSGEERPGEAQLGGQSGGGAARRSEVQQGEERDEAAARRRELPAAASAAAEAFAAARRGDAAARGPRRSRGRALSSATGSDALRPGGVDAADSDSPYGSHAPYASDSPCGSPRDSEQDQSLSQSLVSVHLRQSLGSVDESELEYFTSSETDDLVGEHDQQHASPPGGHGQDMEEQEDCSEAVEGAGVTGGGRRFRVGASGEGTPFETPFRVARPSASRTSELPFREQLRCRRVNKGNARE